MMVLFITFFLLWSLSVAQLSEISQPVAVQTLKLGDPATVKCFINSQLDKRVWYKVAAGRRLQLVASFDCHYDWSQVADEFQLRYSVQFDRNNSHLSISTTSWDDVGTYFCGVMNLNHIDFGSGTFLMLKGATMVSGSVVQQPASQSVQSGGSATLSCSVHSGRCPAEHTTVMWLKSSDHSAPEMIYSAGNGTCQRTEGGETSCVHHLLMRNVSPDEAAAYHCVVTSCGQTLVGSGTRIQIRTDPAGQPPALSLPVLALMLSNILLVTVTLILVWLLCRTRRTRSAEAADGSCEGNQTGDAVVYAAVCSTHRSVAPRRAALKCSGDSVVYSDVNVCQQDREASSGDGGQTREDEGPFPCSY